MMKRLLSCAGVLLVSALSLTAQQKPPASPSATATGTIAGSAISIHYNSPRVRGRQGHIFTKDGLISRNPHYPIWRAGANEATTLETAVDLKIGDLLVPKGTYTLFVNIADPDNWVLILNKKTGEWGLDYDVSQDLGQVKMHMTKPGATVEELKYSIESAGAKSGTITLTWENHSGTVPVAIP
jgi:hypothetical protein